MISIANPEFILVLLTALVLVGSYVYKQWKKDKLEGLAREMFQHFKEYTQSELSLITRIEFDDFSTTVYARFIRGTRLAKFISLTQWREWVWKAFVFYRQRYVAMARYHHASMYRGEGSDAS